MVVDDIGVLPKPRIQGFLAKCGDIGTGFERLAPSEESEGRVPRDAASVRSVVETGVSRPAGDFDAPRVVAIGGHGQVGDIQWLAGVPRERLAIDDDLYSGRLAIDINRTAGDVNDVSVV